jgi:hypothetical protein
MIITGLTEYTVAIVGNIAEGTINVNYRAIMEVLIEVYSEVITRRSTIYIRSQIASQLDTPLISKKRYTISSIRVQETSEIIKSLRPTSKAS